MTHHEPHKSHRSGWLRAAVMGANDGIVSCASLIIGIAAAGSETATIMLAGVAGMVSGAMSMAAGEYVSVSSQADAESADLAIEKAALSENFEGEMAELSDIYQSRGLDAHLADQVAEQLMSHDALGAHARDDIGLSDTLAAKPFQAAFSSGLTFTVGSALPLLAAFVAPVGQVIPTVAGASLAALALLGALSSKAGGASMKKPVLRVVIMGILAMLATAIVGTWVENLMG